MPSIPSKAIRQSDSENLQGQLPPRPVQKHPHNRYLLRVLSRGLQEKKTVMRTLGKKRTRTMKRKMKRKRRILPAAAGLHTGHLPPRSSCISTRATLTTLSAQGSRLRTLCSNRRQSMKSRCSWDSRLVSARNSTQIKIKYKAQWTQ